MSNGRTSGKVRQEGGDVPQAPKDKLGESYSKNIRPFIEVIDSLRKNGLQNDIQLPNVVVVGDQSSGKSSIIESLSGVQLPRGKGIVTRCPLELQLKRMENNVKWKGILTYQGVDYTINRPEDVGRVISEAQDEICGGQKDISDQLLTLRIESNSKTAPELTLIDLPGITRTNLQGQRHDTSSRIRNIIEKFVRNENTVILCVICAHLDLAVNESLQVAKEFDSENERTIGVITKPDLAEHHHKEAVLALLNNESFRLQKGYRMVKCRNQEEIDQNVPLDDILDSEMNFFMNDDIYRHVDPILLGTMNLADKITEELVAVIKNTIPRLKNQVKTDLQKVKSELDRLPKYIPEDEPQIRSHMSHIFYEMIKNIESLLTKGRFQGEGNTDHNIYPTWRNRFQEFQTQISNIQNTAMSQEFTSYILRRQIDNARGREMSCFLKFEVFESLLADHVKKYNPVATNLLSNIRNVTESSLVLAIEHALKNLPTVKNEVLNLVSKAVETHNIKAEENLDLIFEEESLIFAMDSAFQEQITKVFGQSQVVNFPSQDDNSDLLKGIIHSYLNIVRNRMCDTVPMTIRQWTHIRLYKKLHEILMVYLSDAKYLGKIQEDPLIRNKRNALIAKLKRLNIAKDQLSNF